MSDFLKWMEARAVRPMATVNAAPPALKKAIKKKFGATKNKKKITPHNKNTGIDSWLKEVDSLKQAVQKLRAIFDSKKKEKPKLPGDEKPEKEQPEKINKSDPEEEDDELDQEIEKPEKKKPELKRPLKVQPPNKLRSKSSKKDV